MHLISTVCPPSYHDMNEVSSGGTAWDYPALEALLLAPTQQMIGEIGKHPVRLRSSQHAVILLYQEILTIFNDAPVPACSEVAVVDVVFGALTQALLGLVGENAQQATGERGLLLLLAPQLPRLLLILVCQRIQRHCENVLIILYLTFSTFI